MSTFVFLPLLVAELLKQTTVHMLEGQRMFVKQWTMHLVNYGAGSGVSHSNNENHCHGNQLAFLTSWPAPTDNLGFLYPKDEIQS